MCLPSSAAPEASGEIPVAVSCRWCEKPAQPLVLPQHFWEPLRALCSISQSVQSCTASETEVWGPNAER